MALADITLADGQAVPVSHVFTYIQTSGNRVIRTDFTAPAEEPLILTMAHQDTKISGFPGKSHLWRMDKSKLDADGVTVHKANFRFMLDLPNAILADALLKDFAAFGRNALTEAFILAFGRGSVF